VCRHRGVVAVPNKALEPTAYSVRYAPPLGLGLAKSTGLARPASRGLAYPPPRWAASHQSPTTRSLARCYTIVAMYCTYEDKVDDRKGALCLPDGI